MSFRCEHCHYTNNEIQPGGRIQDKGVRYAVTIRNERDLCRQVVKSDHATLSVPEIELEIPPMSQKGEVTTVEGVLQRTVAGQEQDHDLCLYTKDEVRDTDDPVLKKTESSNDEVKELHDEVLQFPTNCPECNAPCETNMKM